MIKPENVRRRTPARAGWRMRFLMVILLVACGLSQGTAAEATAPKAAVDLTDLPIEALMNLDVPTVYGASKFEQKTTEAPSSISIVSAEEIQRYGYRTLADVLRSLQGFHVSYDRNYAFLGTRGVNLGDFNSRTLLLVDGHRVNNNLTDGAFIDTAFILDIDLVDRVEVIRGPGSTLYGNNAFFDVVNVVTRSGKKIDGIEFSSEYGGFDSYKGRVTFGKMFTNGLEMLISGSYYDSGGADRLFYKEYNTSAQNNGIARNLDFDNYGSGFASFAYGGFTLEGAYINREKGNPTAQFFTTFNDPRLRTVDERGYGSLKFVHDFPDILDLTAQVYYDQNTFEIGYPVGDPGSTTLFKEEQEGQWWGSELQVSRHLWDRHIITAGVEYRDDFLQEQKVFDPASGRVFSDHRRERQSYGFYAEGDFAVRTNLHFNGGIRYDRYGDFDPKVNPRLALIYNPAEQSTLKAVYATAFRTPNFLELSDPRFQDISPEEITAYELIYEQGIGRHLRTSLAGFYNQMDNLIVLQNGSYTNLDADSKGVELALEASWTNGLRGRASYTYQKTSGNLPDSPENLFKFNLSAPLYRDKIFAGLEYQFTGDRHTLFTTTTGTTLAGTDAQGFGVLNFTLFSQNLVKNLDISASIYNLLDETYSDPASRFHLQDKIANDGRSFRVKVTYRF
jgi:outer membrane receptor for ferrienterochelin and colicins